MSRRWAQPAPEPVHTQRNTDRGQTTQDFALGIGVFLVTVAFVLVFVPSILIPFQSGPTAGERAAAEAITTNVTDNLSDQGYATRLNETRTRDFFENHNSTDEIRANYSVPLRRLVNVTIVNLDGTPVSGAPFGGYDPTAGDDPRDRPTAVASRVVEYQGDTFRLEVRVW